MSDPQIIIEKSDSFDIPIMTIINPHPYYYGVVR